MSENKLDLVIKPFHALPCSLEVFTINGQKADLDDFGHMSDDGKDDDDYEDKDYEDMYSCKCMCFHANLTYAYPAMKKYNLTLEQFVEVCNQLKDALNVGECGWCI